MEITLLSLACLFFYEDTEKKDMEKGDNNKDKRYQKTKI